MRIIKSAKKRTLKEDEQLRQTVAGIIENVVNIGDEALLNMFMPMKHMIPMIKESINFPLINCPNVLLTYLASYMNLNAFSSFIVANISFLHCAANMSLLFRKNTHMIIPTAKFFKPDTSPNMLLETP